MRVALDFTVTARSQTGVGVYAREIATALRAEGLDLLRWRQRLGPPGRGAARIVGGIRLALWLHHGVPRLVRENGVTVLHSLSAVGSLNAPCARVMTVHDTEALAKGSQYGPLDRLYHRVSGVLAARRAHAVMVPSAASADGVERVYRVRRERITVVPHAAGRLFTPPRSEEIEPVLRRYGIARPYVLFAGHAVPRKNLARLIRAFAEIGRGSGQARAQLVIAGPPGPSTPALRRLVEGSPLAGWVRFIDCVRRADLRVLYGAATCLAYPSLREGFGLPILEAFACGTPVLTSNLSSMPEVAGDAALLVDPRDVESIADGLRRLLTDPSLGEDLTARGLARTREFSWRSAACQTRAVYEIAQARARAGDPA